MFQEAVKTLAIEAFVALYDDPNYIGLKPRSVDIEYPEKDITWPAFFIQFRPGTVQWTGINPDRYQGVFDPPFTWATIREGYFEGSIDVTILALSSAERDQLWDKLVQVVLMGRKSSTNKAFWTSLDQNNLVRITLQQDTITPLGDSVGVGTPWDPNVLSYEATLRINCVGEFFADIVDEKLLSLSAIQVFPYTDIESPPGENDGQGAWVSL